MSVCKISPGKAMPVSWLLTAVTAAIFWHMPYVVIMAASIQGLIKSLDIILIVFGAILLLNVLKCSGALRTINNTFSEISPDRRIQVIVIAWIFGGFIEGVSGFGAAPALAAPLLVGLGFPAVTALAVTLICNTLPVPFAAAGLPVISSLGTLTDRIALTGMSESEFNHAVFDKLTAISGLSGLFIPLLAISLMILLSKRPGKLRSIIQITPLALFSAAAYILPWRLTALYIGPELPSMIGAIICFPAILLCIKWRIMIPKEVWDFHDNEKHVINTVQQNDSPLMPSWQAWMPYIVLAGGLLILRFPLLPFKELLNSVTLKCPDIFGVANTGSSWKILNNPGILPFCVLASASALLWKIPVKKHLQIYSDTFKQIIMTILALSAGVAMVQIMVFSSRNADGLPGMLNCIANSVAALTGKGFLAGSPFIGIFGTFFAGSCTVSNILFTALQFDTAHALNSDTMLATALQNLGGGLGSMIRISGIIAACATVKAAGQEVKLLLLNVVPVLLLTLLALTVMWILY
ncbi:MAG: L-lactate permease [Lentisphaeria bacterium]|nr:L-lactate permease [Lentisphaeria bacterium]